MCVGAVVGMSACEVVENNNNNNINNDNNSNNNNDNMCDRVGVGNSAQ